MFQRNILRHLRCCTDLTSKVEVIFLSETLILTFWSTSCQNLEGSVIIFCLLIVIRFFRKDGCFVIFFTDCNQYFQKRLCVLLFVY
jgi:hypothetical protein